MSVKRAKRSAETKVKVNVRVKKSAPSVKAAAKSPAKQKANNSSKPPVKPKDKQTRIEILQTLAQNTNMTRVQIETIFDELNKIIAAHISKRGSGEITIPKTGIKVRRVKKRASKERRMVSPLTGQEVTIAAKPVRYAVKISALKPLKELVEA